MRGPGTILRSSLAKNILSVVLTGCLFVSLIRLMVPLRDRFRLERSLLSATQQRASLDLLYPFYEELLKVDHVSDWPALVLPAPQPLEQDDVLTVSDLFMRMAEAHELTLERVQLKVVSEPGKRVLRVSLPMSGLYRQMGPFLKDLVRLPSLETIERISVQLGNVKDSFNIELRLSLK